MSLAFRWLTRLLLVVAASTLLWPDSAHAHRPGESYVYLIISEGPLDGEIHVRISDMAKAVQLDANGDGVVTDEEAADSYYEVAKYLTDRLRFFDGGAEHVPVPGKLWFFGPSSARQMVLNFRVPSIDPPPDELMVAYRFLYDGIDAEHRPMLLLKSNPRMGVEENEAFVSLVFEPGVGPQVVSLVPLPFVQLVPSMMYSGILHVVLSPFHLMIIVAALLGCLHWLSQQDDETRGGKELAMNVAGVAGLFALGYAAGLLFRDLNPARLSDDDIEHLFAAALGLAALANILVARTKLRWVALFVAGALCGATPSTLVEAAGWNIDRLGVVILSYALGVFAAACLLGAAILPLGATLTQSVPRVASVIRVLSVGVFALAVVFLVNRTLIM